MKTILILAALVAAPLAAHAETGATGSVQISSAGLDLANPADAQAMILRIQAAVRPMCVAPGYAARRSTAGCVRDVTRLVVSDMNVPQLTLALRQGAPAVTRMAAR